MAALQLCDWPHQRKIVLKHTLIRKYDNHWFLRIVTQKVHFPVTILVKDDSAYLLTAVAHVPEEEGVTVDPVKSTVGWILTVDNVLGGDAN